MNSNFWYSVTITEALKRVAPSLDLNGADIRILKICLQDFNDYHNWLKKQDDKRASSNLSERERMKKISVTVNFIEVWVGLWWAKYKERVKLLFKEPEKNPLLKMANENLGKFTMKEQMDIVEMIAEEFIKNGEICAARILADMVFMRVLGRYGRKKYWTKEDKFNLLPPLRSEARTMSKVHGPLLFMKIDKKYYKLREFRDDGVAQGL